jgi:hypothetical protein
MNGWLTGNFEQKAPILTTGKARGYIGLAQGISENGKSDNPEMPIGRIAHCVSSGVKNGEGIEIGPFR